MNNPFDYTPDTACEEAFQKLIKRISELKKSDRADDVLLCRELDEGKMLGVLIALDNHGERQELYAFSGQLGDNGFYHPLFVGPIFDYLNPESYFKKNESAISSQNVEIAHFKNEILATALNNYEAAKARLFGDVDTYSEKCRQSKIERDLLRASGNLTPDQHAKLIGQSQFEKAELRRLKKQATTNLQPFADALKEAELRFEAMKEKRRSDSEALQKWLFDNFKLLNGRGESKSLSEIFADTPTKIAPSGAGECCAPKLLQAAYLKGLKPVAIAEYWYGKPKRGELRIHSKHYPACRGKCLSVLSWMLQGIAVEPPLGHESWLNGNQEPKIIFENDRFCVVDKPAGMLSVPGKTGDRSVEQWLNEKYGITRFVKVAHRLDQDTSGLLIATFDPESFKTMQSLFATRKVIKTYVADLDGNYISLKVNKQGSIDLPLSPDWLDRPRQLVDIEGGKSAVTDYEFIDVTNDTSRVIFHPLTGRTHQLRVHSASESGLNMPIVGDRLYGKSASTTQRLHLHAAKIEFTFPFDDKLYCFESPVPF